MLKAVGRLYLLHITAALAIWAAMYYPGWDKLCAVLYLIVLIAEIHVLVPEKQSIPVLALAWSLPWAVVSLCSIFNVDWWGMGDIGIFVLNCWYLPWLPWLAFAKTTIAGYPLYYYLLLSLPWVNFVLVLAISYYSILFRDKTALMPGE